MTEPNIHIVDGPSPLDMGISLLAAEDAKSHRRPVVRFTLEHPLVKNILPQGRWFEAVIDGLHRVGDDRIDWDIEGTIVDVPRGVDYRLELRIGQKFTASFNSGHPREGALHLT